jgi:hypothetical protein
MKAMKKSGISILIVMLMLMSVACTPKALPVIGFDTDLREESRGLTMMHVGGTAGSVKLHGEIHLSSGSMKLEFVNPEGDVMYNRCIQSPSHIYVDEIEPCIRGLWKLRYTCTDGEGYINLHMYR